MANPQATPFNRSLRQMRHRIERPWSPQGNLHGVPRAPSKLTWGPEPCNNRRRRPLPAARFFPAVAQQSTRPPSPFICAQSVASASRCRSAARAAAGRLPSRRNAGFARGQSRPPVVGCQRAFLTGHRRSRAGVRRKKSVGPRFGAVSKKNNSKNRMPSVHSARLADPALRGTLRPSGISRLSPAPSVCHVPARAPAAVGGQSRAGCSRAGCRFSGPARLGHFGARAPQTGAPRRNPSGVRGQFQLNRGTPDARTAAIPGPTPSRSCVGAVVQRRGRA